jgi:hypothetical protein
LQGKTPLGDLLPDGADEDVEMAFKKEMALDEEEEDYGEEYEDEVDDIEETKPKESKKGFISIDNLGAKPSTGNPGYGVSSVFDDEINQINDLTKNFRNHS